MLRPDTENKYPVGSTPPRIFIPYLVIASFLVSLIGSSATVELLHRRVSSAGWRSWVDITICSVAFGLVAVWCMHSVGNRAIVLGDGREEIQLYYDVTYSVLSAILPIIPAFVGLSISAKLYEIGHGVVFRFGSLAWCGLCTGGAAMTVQYLGNSGIRNLIASYELGNILGAAAIAMVTCSAGFGLLFYWGKRWMNNIWRRMLVSSILGLGIWGMHWTAVVGTRYQIQGYHDGEHMDRNTNLIVAGCLLAISCIGCSILCYINERRLQQREAMAQQVVLAVGLFDDTGKLLVDKTGLMPCQTFTHDFGQIALDDEFNTSHPVFQWIFRVTRNWAGISDLIPSMRGNLQSDGQTRTSHYESNDSTRSTTFRELFCITAESIATSLNMTLETLGCLYEDILTIGTTVNNGTIRESTNLGTATPDIKAAINNLESGKIIPTVFGKGQMLLLTKTVDNTEAQRLQQLGYIFADVEQVSDNLARSLQVPCGDVEYLMARLHAFSVRQHHVPKKGTYLASFLIQPRPGMKEMDVVVRRANPGQLPIIKLADDQLDSRQLELLSTFNGLTLDKCLVQIERSSKSEAGDTAFMQKFHNGIQNLLRECSEETLHSARFSAQQLDMVHGQTQFSEAKVFAFCGIKEIYIQSLQSLTLKTIPFSFFNTYLRSQPECVDHEMLAKRNRDEFRPLQQAHPDAESPTTLGTVRSMILRKKKSSCNVKSWNAETSSVNSRAKYRLTRSLTAASAHLWSGMVMTSIMNINSADCETEGKGNANMGDMECQTLADRLIIITTSFRGSHSNQAPFQLGTRK